MQRRALLGCGLLGCGRTRDTTRSGAELRLVANQRRLATGLDGLGMPPMGSRIPQPRLVATERQP
jgi:hypothetical protein